MRSLTTIEFIVESEPMTARGFPHSEIQGSSLLSSYPWLIAAWYVLHRLWSQGIHLVPFNIFDVIALATITEISCCEPLHMSLTHESSSLCSFQRSRCDHFTIVRLDYHYSKLRRPIVSCSQTRSFENLVASANVIALSGTLVPSKLNSAVP